MDSTLTWHEANQRYLASAVASVGQLLAQHLRRGDHEGADLATTVSEMPELTEVPELTEKLDMAEVLEMAESRVQPALECLVEIFELSPFERSLLVLCAGVELDAEVARLCAALHPNRRPDPTFGLALAALPDAHWSALNPSAPLRRWRLLELEVGGSSGWLLTTRPLRLDERILHYLTGIQYLDERLAGLIDPVVSVSAPGFEEDELVPSHRELAERIATSLRGASEDARRRGHPLPLVQLTGPESGAKLRIASSVAADLGMDLAVLSGTAVPTSPAERDGLRRLWEREAALTGCALLVDLEDLDEPGASAGEGSDHGGAQASRESAIARLVDDLQGLVLVTSRGPRRGRRRAILSFEVPRPSPQEQSQLWRNALAMEASSLDGPSLNGHMEKDLEGLASQFSLEASSLADAARQALAETEDSSPRALRTALWNAARGQCRPKVDHLAQIIETAATWDDLVLPPEQKEILGDLAAQVRHRYQVHEHWGFAAKSSRGLGITALFAGVSGTGKTLAAEVLANTLQLDLYRIDLSAVISKYIGETEKNLRRVFDAAEQGGAVLLFDEADALFGKRSEVKDSHDRYANVEISYLLQRMEAYRGLAILTTNMKSALDNAFLRRLRFVVEFPFPDVAQRAEIWQRIFPSQTPTESLEPAKLARLNVAGGTIRNIALGGAFAAAEEGSPVSMAHLLQAARCEYRKMEKPLNEAETRGWLASEERT